MSCTCPATGGMPFLLVQLFYVWHKLCLFVIDSFVWHWGGGSSYSPQIYIEFVKGER